VRINQDTTRYTAPPATHRRVSRDEIPARAYSATAWAVPGHVVSCRVAVVEMWLVS